MFQRLRSTKCVSDPSTKVSVFDDGRRLVLVLETEGGSGLIGSEWPYSDIIGWGRARRDAIQAAKELTSDPHFPCACVPGPGFDPNTQD